MYKIHEIKSKRQLANNQVSAEWKKRMYHRFFSGTADHKLGLLGTADHKLGLLGIADHKLGLLGIADHKLGLLGTLWVPFG